MKFARSCLRYAHTTGHTYVVYSNDSEFIVTCGSDGDLRRWTCITDDDPSSDGLGEFVSSIEWQGARLLVCGDRNSVQAYTFPDLKREDTLFRFTASATCVCVRENYIAAGSEDTNIQVLKEGDSQPIHLSGHAAPVLALDIFPAKQLVASIAGEGVLKIWDLSSSTELKSISGFPKINSFESAICFGTPCFEPKHGNELAFARDKEIHIVSTSTWQILYKLIDERVRGNYTYCRYSPNGDRLAAGTSNGEISVFQIQNRRTISVDKPPTDAKSICSLAWHPIEEGVLAFCDSSGQLGTITYGSGAASEAGLPGDGELLEDNDFADFEFADDEAAEGADEKSEPDGSSTHADDVGVIAGDDEDDEDEDGNCISLEKLKQKVMNASMKANGRISPDNDVNDEDAKSSIASFAPAAKTFKQQTAFQPSASPKELDHRYMAWNAIGIVTSHADETNRSIDVEFHDTNVHHAMHITNHSNHDIASLSTTALALATTDTTELMVIALSAVGNKEWKLHMPDCETIETIIATNKLVAVTTSSYFLRIFTVMGSQREVISIPGPVVALAGHENSLFVVYHSAPSSTNQQYLSAYLVQAHGLGLRVHQIPVPLTPERRLVWLGFSDRGSPVFADSMGLVQLYRIKSGAWFPICDTMKQSSSVSNNYFVICVKEAQQVLRAVLCRGSAYPMTNPRPIAQELPMSLPLCDIENEKSELEDALLRASILQADGCEKIIKTTAVKLFSLACCNESEGRAKELIEAISCPELLQLAVKYATNVGRIHLSDSLTELLPQIEQEQALRRRLDEQGTGAIIAPIYVTMPTTSNTLTPKPIELASAKRGALIKRFSQATPTTNKSNGSSSSSSSRSTATAGSLACKMNQSPLNTQADIFDSESEPMNATENVTTPTNLVNPFAMKRKLATTGVIFGSAKLKMVKKK